MAIELRQQLKLTQQLVMTPQLQQAIKLLQLSRLELVSTVQQELEENPVLEESYEEDLAEEGSREDAPAEAIEVAAQSERESAAELPERDPVPDMDWATYGEGQSSPGPAVIRDDEERPGVEAVATRRPTLQEHLEWQLQLSSFTELERGIASWILGNLDDDGYLRSSVEEVARQAGASDDAVAATLTRIQRLDPPGVAARDLRELAHLARGERAVGNGDAQHIGVELHIEAVHQPERPELLLSELTFDAALDLMAELRHALVDQRLVEFVVAVHRV